MRVAIAALIALSALAHACAKDDGPDQAKDWDAPPPMAPAERETGMTACEAYQARVCACAGAAPELAEECKLAKARPAALAELLAMLDGKSAKLGPKAYRATQATARKTIRSCFEADAVLDPATCPRVAR